MKDNFSRQSELYSTYRPSYPQNLFDFILSHVTERDSAWDCGTGNGQTAKELSNYFKNVYATDISEAQIQKGYKADNIFYSIQAAEQTNFTNNSFDLVTVSQALHWFSFRAFYQEVNRTVKPGGWIAAWTYNLPSVSETIDQLIRIKLYKETLENYWDYERKLVDENYTTIPFPFEEISTPNFNMYFMWTLDELIGYINSWSAIQKFIAVNSFNPADDIKRQIQPFWAEEKMKIIFSLYLRMGKVTK